MNVTFMIGNGFDLRLGMNTRYTDMYEGYLAEKSDSFVISEFKQILKQDAPNGYQSWADFEIAMARHASNYNVENDFIQCIRDFKKYMATHLQREQDGFIEKASMFRGACASEMFRSLEEFYYGQIPNVVNDIKELQGAEDIHYNFISFNYTISLDYLLENLERQHGVKTPDPVHIHGHLDSDIVLGIDNESQLGPLKFVKTNRFNRAFIKPSFNDTFDKLRVQNAINHIERSQVICVYGMSLGDSDIRWREKLCEWLKSNENHHLIYFEYNTNEFSKWNRDEMIEEEEARKERFLMRICEDTTDIEQLFDRVHIPVGFDIFDFKEIINDPVLINHFDSDEIPAFY